MLETKAFFSPPEVKLAHFVSLQENDLMNVASAARLSNTNTT